MGCVTANYLKNCAFKTVGGINEIYIQSSDSVDSVTGGGGTPVTGVTMNGTEVFNRFQFQNNEATFTEVPGENGVITQTLTFNVRGRSQELRNAIQELIDCQCGLTIIHRENAGAAGTDGTYYIWGFKASEEATFPAGDGGTSGTAKSDPNQETITLTAEATAKADTFTGTIPV